MDTAPLKPLSLHQKWQFGLDIGGMEVAAFQKCPLPKMTFDEVEFNQAGSIFPQKAAGRVKFTDITIEKGVFQEEVDTYIIDWIKKCLSMDPVNHTGGFVSEYQKDIDIIQYDRKGTEIKRWRLYGAYIKEADFGELEGGSSDNTIESMTISYQYFENV